MDAASQPESQNKRVKRERSTSPAAITTEGPPDASPHRQCLASLFFYDVDADVELVSDDNVHFKIQSYHLLAASPYFRRLRNTSEMVSPLHLTVDGSGAIEDLLTLITRRPLVLVNPAPVNPGPDAQPEQPASNTCEWQLDDTFVHRVTRLVAICQRWECEILLEQVISKMRDALVLPKCHAVPIFLASAMALNNPMMCYRALPIAARRVWPEPAKGSGHQSTLATGLRGRSMLDVAAMPLHMLEELPAKYVAALSRAFLQRKLSRMGEVQNWDVVAKEFYRLLTAE